MTLSEKNFYGTLVVKFMTQKISAAEETQLHDWVSKDEDCLVLFENLIDDNNQRWAQQWFYEADVKTTGVKWKKKSGWYKPETKSLRDFYLVMLAVFAFLFIVYLVLK